MDEWQKDEEEKVMKESLKKEKEEREAYLAELEAQKTAKEMGIKKRTRTFWIVRV